MATSIKKFYIELYEEYLDDASALYEAMLTLYEDAEISWLDIADWEARYEPYIAGLSVGNDLALDVCNKKAHDGDFGELHAAVRVFCRQNRPDMLLALLGKDFDYEDGEKVKAVLDALKYEMPDNWLSGLLPVLASGHQPLVGILAAVFGYRRLPATMQLLNALSTASSEGKTAILTALGRLQGHLHGYLQGYLQGNEASDVVYQHLSLQNAMLQMAALNALLRMGDQRAVSYIAANALRYPSLWIKAAQCGDRSLHDRLIEHASHSALNAEQIVALGIIGDIRAIQTIPHYLTDPDTATAAAHALFLITGAALYETVFISDAVDTDVLFEEELKKYQETGELPKNADGQPMGENIRRLSQNPDDWRQWWQKHARRFTIEQRFRLGQLYSPKALINTLTSESTPAKIRQCVYEELVIRYGLKVAFEYDMRVSEQLKRIADMEAWNEKHHRRFDMEQYYFCGLPSNKGEALPVF